MNSKLIIVCDKSTKKYANYLRQLISLNDDSEEKIVGIEDGSLNCIVWDENDYLNNSKKMSSTEHVLFIGNNKTTKEEKSGIKYLFDKYDMKYGWLGKRAILLIDGERDNKKDYEDFCKYCIERNIDIEQLEFIERNEFENNNKLKNTFRKIVNKAVDVKNNSNTKIFNHRNIVEQKYKALIKLFYLDSLKKFLGE